MRSTKRMAGFMLVIVFLCFVFGVYSCEKALAQTSVSTTAGEVVQDMPIFGGVLVHQAGSSLLLVEVKGTKLPSPKLLHSDPGNMVFFFAGTSMPAQQWSRSYSFPLLRGSKW